MRVSCLISDIVIERQPVSVCVPVNFKVTLSVGAVAAGIVKYQWFICGDDGDIYEVCGRHPSSPSQFFLYSPEHHQMHWFTFTTYILKPSEIEIVLTSYKLSTSKTRL